MMRRLVRIAGAVFLAWLVAASVLFLLPHGTTPRTADAIVVLAGDREQRVDKALELMRSGVSRTLVVSGWPDPAYARAAPYCSGESAYRVICFMPSPFSTRGEAREIARLARANGWHSVAVVTSDYHVFRAGLIVRRCYHGPLAMVGTGSTWWRMPANLVLETGKLALALTLRRGC
jgi:uncharacterized SAM-binding protein YcdF (DUF218 family)